MAIWKTYRVADVVSSIGEEKFVLPVIQRSLVWTEDKMELLFDTLLKGDSFGGVMVIEEEKDSRSLFSFRPFTKDGNFISSMQIDRLAQQQYFVIDGQQRLQSFYIGLKGSINGKVLFFDLFSDFNSEYEFKFENDTNKLPKQSKENIDRPIPEHFWYSVKGLLEKLKNTGKYKQVVKEIIDQSKITGDSKKDCIEENVLSFYENILNSETLGISKVVINKSLPELDNRQRIVELFRRLNDGGTKLSSFDLVASILKGFSWEMEGFLREMLEDYKAIDLSQDNLIKLIFLLQDNYNKEMASIEASDADFAIQNKDRIKATIKALKDFLEYSRTYEYYKDGNRSFVPLFFIAYHLFHKQIDNAKLEHYFDNYESGNVDFPLIKCWLYHSLINGVFRSKGAGWIPYKTGIKKILETIKQCKNKIFPLNELFQIYIDHPITFTLAYTADNLDQLDSVFIYYLIYDRARTSRTNDIDHIMPRSILESMKFDPVKINSIKNFQLLDYGTNRGTKKAKPFGEWVSNPEYVKDKTAFLSLHLIPDDEILWLESNFEKFIDLRAALILSKIEKYSA
jgi:uncharacterized protein with ParB-like and HNH nuclease domain